MRGSNRKPLAVLCTLGILLTAMGAVLSVQAEVLADTFTITTSVTNHVGGVIEDGKTVSRNEGMTIAITPDEGYYISDIKVNDVPVDDYSAKLDDTACALNFANSFTLTDLTDDIAFEVAFAPIFTMETGASIRFASPGGLRFKTYVANAFKNDLDAKGCHYEFGTLVSRSLGADGVLTTADTCSKIKAEHWHTLSPYVTDEWAGYQAITGVIINIPETHYKTVLYSRAYFTCDGKTVYSAFSIDDQARSIKQVAQAALDDPRLNILNYSQEEITTLKKYAGIPVKEREPGGTPYY